MVDSINSTISIHYTGVEVGEIRTLQHDVSGTLHVINSTTLFIDNFNFDGVGLSERTV